MRSFVCRVEFRMGEGLLTPLELAAGIPVGSETRVASLPRPRTDPPLIALERAALSALVREPCVVSFSGGRDSSAILAVAARVARREGLAPPIPVTLRFPAVPSSDEATWQERVVRYLRLQEWVKVELSEELDLIGPIASPALRRHGVMWPPNTHFHQPVLQLARGGALLTGIDGDGLFGSWRWMRLVGVLTRQVQPEPRDALRLLLALSPPSMLRAIGQRRATTWSWLRPAAVATLRRALGAEAATEPLRWNARVEWYARRRSLHLTRQSLTLLARDFDVLDVHPLADPAFLAAIAQAGRWSGLGDRTGIMRTLFAGLLPDDVLSRETKASLDAVFWNRHSRQFFQEWSGEGVNADLVDLDALRKEWLQPVPHAYTSTLLQAAWLASVDV